MDSRIGPTVPELLSQIGWPTGRLGRTCCPLHKGTNKHAFVFNNEQWFCFSKCGRGGSAYQLAKELGLVKPNPWRAPRLRGLEGVLQPFYEPGLGLGIGQPRRGARNRMERAIGRQEQTRLERVTDQLSWGSFLVTMGQCLFEVAPYRVDFREIGMATVCAGLGAFEDAERQEQVIQGRIALWKLDGLSG